jgi:hypothetical protein
LFPNEIGLTVIVIFAKKTLKNQAIQLKQNYLADRSRQFTHMREYADRAGRNGIEGEEVCIVD